jgi:hypothetical protein
MTEEVRCRMNENDRGVRFMAANSDLGSPDGTGEPGNAGIDVNPSGRRNGDLK